MAEENVTVIYNAPPIWAKMTAWALLGIGGIVLLPIALIRGDHWLLAFAVPLTLVGLLLLSIRLHIALLSPASVVRVTNFLLGLRMRQRQYLRSEVTSLDLDRVAGDERERASDTWYVRLRLRNRGYTIGRYDSRISALLARRDVNEALQTLPPPPVEAEAVVAAQPRDARRRDIARDHYKTGITLFSAGDRDGARAAFRQALPFAQEPLLRRMIEQRLEELERR